MKASPLLRAWLGRLDGLGVELRTRSRWTGCDGRRRLAFETPDGERVETPTRRCWRWAGPAGRGWARTGPGSRLLEAAGVAVAPFRPANVGFDVAWTGIFADGSPGSR